MLPYNILILFNEFAKIVIFLKKSLAFLLPLRPLKRKRQLSAMANISNKAVQMPASAIRKLVPMADAAKK